MNGIGDSMSSRPTILNSGWFATAAAVRTGGAGTTGATSGWYAQIGDTSPGVNMRTVLVVEDDQSIARLIRDYLDRAGYAVITGADGDSASPRARQTNRTCSCSTWDCRVATAFHAARNSPPLERASCDRDCPRRRNRSGSWS